ncbi:hypothetical protein EGW08_004004 [Elysia chlorotica]|uniref:Cathepsin B-like cysteine proteinase n=1 Tax=Elysia chlorotica TaxID=188477 RepID=A0A3S1BTC4_ELYCH|nr:hypothetical protein EGW08_004004 [Elysia chlorotica]
MTLPPGMAAMRTFLAAVAGLVVLVGAPGPKPDFGMLSDEEIYYINHVAKTTWTAGQNFHPKDERHVKRILGVHLKKHHLYLHAKLPLKVFKNAKEENLPTNFDARTHWPHCPSLREVRDQGDCGSCWAFGAVECMTDRLCIRSKGKTQFHFSAEELLTCCKQCGRGYVWLAICVCVCLSVCVSVCMSFVQSGCQPYEIPACDHHVIGHLQPCTKKMMPTPTCKKKCDPGYNISFHDDKRYGLRTYHLRGELNIMQELVSYGPVEAAFTVYSDFTQYKSGGGPSLGGHAVKILGYGTENGTKYWLVANSWNTDWGDQGFFKILRGHNHCGIESQIVAGDPRL